MRKVVADAMEFAAAAFVSTGRVEIPDDHRQRVTDVLMGMWGAAARQAGRALINEFKGDFPLEGKDDEPFFDMVVERFIEMYGARKITLITEATKSQVREIILRAQMNGATVQEAADQVIAAIPGASKTRAHIIARTETHGAANFAAVETAKTSRRPLLKEWVSAEDHRTRDFGEGDGVIDQYSHRVMNGERVPTDAPFMVPNKFGGQEPLMHPGDPLGSAGNVINCRCAMNFVRPE